jgi:hypothetical protein
MAAHPETPRHPHLVGCTGFWLWALVGFGAVLGFISLAWITLAPATVVAIFLLRRKDWADGPVLLGLVSGAGFTLLLVAALNWNDWQHRTPGNEYPNPYHWGIPGAGLVLAGMLGYSVMRWRGSRRRH